MIPNSTINKTSNIKKAIRKNRTARPPQKTGRVGVAYRYYALWAFQRHVQGHGIRARREP